MKLYLIGLMGSGKSNLGKKISTSIQLPFIDLDDVLEAQEGMKVSKIFSTKGQEYFRKIEAEALRAQSKSEEFVMATGGGTPCFYDNMTFINQTGTSVFLDTAVDVVVSRFDAAQLESRPLLEGEAGEGIIRKLENMREKRLPFYEQAHFTINGATAKAWDIIQLAMLKK
jgi:shikimate kinase